jgi:hypothetical protein
LIVFTKVIATMMIPQVSGHFVSLMLVTRDGALGGAFKRQMRGIDLFVVIYLD